MQENVARSRFYAWAVVAVLCLIWLLNYLDRQIIFSVFPPLRKELGLTDIQLGLLGTSFLWVYAAASPFTGFLADRFGRVRLITLSLLVWSALTWITGHTSNFSELMTVRALMGVSEACYLPAGLALIASYHGPRTLSRATGVHYTGAYLGTILGGTLGGWFGVHYGWRAAFVFLGVFGILYSAFVFLFLRENSSAVIPAVTLPKLGFFAACRAVFALRDYPLMILVFAAVSIGDWAVYTWMPDYLFEHFHMGLTEAGFTATFYLKGGGFLGILGGGLLADKWSAHNGRGRSFTQAAGLLLGAPFLFLAGFSHSTLLLICGLALYGIGKGFYDCNVMPVLCQVAGPDIRSTGYGLFNWAGCVAGGAVAVIAGALKSTLGIGGIIEIAAVLIMLGGALLLRIRPAPLAGVREEAAGVAAA